MYPIPRQLYYILGGALLVRLLLILAITLFLGEESLLISDAPRFHKIAVALADGHGFTIGDFPYEPSAFFPPIFFLILGGSIAVFDSLLPAVSLHVLLGSLLPLLVWGISGFLTEDHRIRLFAVGLTAFEPQMILWSIVPTTEIVATFAMLTAFYLFLKLLREFRWQDAAFSGFFLALSTLTRPHGQFLFILAILFLVILFLKRRKDRGGLRYAMATTVFLVFFLLTLSPWLIRNYYHFGTFSVATTGLRNIYSDYAVAVNSLVTGVPFGEMRVRMYEELAKEHGVTSKEIREDPALGDTVAKEGLIIIFAQPKESIQVLATALIAFFTQDLYTFYLQHFRVITEFRTDFSPSVVLVTEGPFSLAERIWNSLGAKALLPVLGRIVWVILSIGWISGAIFAIRQGGWQRTLALLMVIVIFYYAATSAIGAFSDQGRLRYPVNSFIFILASLGIFEIVGRLSSEYLVPRRQRG